MGTRFGGRFLFSEKEVSGAFGFYYQDKFVRERFQKS